jgi:hypothetical protein
VSPSSLPCALTFSPAAVITGTFPRSACDWPGSVMTATTIRDTHVRQVILMEIRAPSFINQGVVGLGNGSWRIGNTQFVNHQSKPRAFTTGRHSGRSFLFLLLTDTVPAGTCLLKERQLSQGLLSGAESCRDNQCVNRVRFWIARDLTGLASDRPGRDRG